MFKFTEDRYRIYTDNTSVVIALTTYAGKTIKGVAKTDPLDTFDFDKGRTLAIARCNFKVANKRVERAARRYAEAHTQTEEAEKHEEEMHSYLTDAFKAAVLAEKNISELEHNMKASE